MAGEMTPGEPMTFEEFMRLALHDPQRGYYARKISGVGRRGDFTTAPMLNDSLARAVAGWVVAAMRETDCRNLIEIGPGEGRLCRQIFKRLPWHTRMRTRVHLVETSTPLREKQRELLGGKAVWHDHPSKALAACAGNAVIFSNELVDAFPVRRFEKTRDGWQEIAVSFDETGRALERLLSPAPLPDSAGFCEEFTIGQRIEVHESYRKWLEGWLPDWKSGRMLTIDYGATADTIYQRRPRGTVRAYLLQQRLEGAEIYQNIGRQDLTADVNFTDLIEWPKPLLETTRLETLSGFLKRSGIEDPELTDENGAGGAFMVLDQARSDS